MSDAPDVASHADTVAIVSAVCVVGRGLAEVVLVKVRESSGEQQKCRAQGSVRLRCSREAMAPTGNAGPGAHTPNPTLSARLPAASYHRPRLHITSTIARMKGRYPRSPDA
jgi:hypothetical protein